MGIGLTLLSEKEDRSNMFADFAEPNIIYTNYLYFSPKIAYRYQKNNGGLFFKFTLTPFSGGITKKSIDLENHSYFYCIDRNGFLNSLSHWVGLSAGFTF